MLVKKSVAANLEFEDLRQQKEMIQQFETLHQQESPILLCNVWDVPSAKLAEKLHFKAIGTSSGAIAEMLGYRDGEEMDFAELLHIVKRIKANVQTPLTVDLEAGYSREPRQIAEHVRQLLELGVVGINLEDSLVDQERYLLEAEAFANHLEAVIQELGDQAKDIFINVRTDTFLLGQPKPLEETLARAKIYHRAGANGLFVPCIEQQADIQRIVEESKLPINVMCMPALPSFSILEALGVKRISMGNFLHKFTLKQMESSLKLIVKSSEFKSLFQ